MYTRSVYSIYCIQAWSLQRKPGTANGPGTDEVP